MRVVVADLGLGNLRSVERALARAAAEAESEHEVVVGRAPEVLASADLLVFPGQGSFRAGAAALATAAGRVVAEHLKSGRPYLGICLGLQLLFDSSDEAPGAAGLGHFRGVVRRLGGEHLAAVGTRKVPHMGWNRVSGTCTGPLSIVAGEYVYFVHSFAAVPDEQGLVGLAVDYGAELTAAVACANVVAVQFHPEKSQLAGQRLLRAVLAWADGNRPR